MFAVSCRSALSSIPRWSLWMRAFGTTSFRHPCRISAQTLDSSCSKPSPSCNTLVLHQWEQDCQRSIMNAGALVR